MINEIHSALSRRSVIGAGLAGVAATVAGAAPAAGAPLGAPAVGPGIHPANPAPSAATVSWRRLMAGNTRFRLGEQRHPHEQLDWREKLVNGQQPFACVLGCADSRVPPELVFDHGLGDLFTVRAAGEVLDDAVVGSIEYAVEHLKVPLVVVLGHESCGAVRAAVDLVRSGGELAGPVSALVRTIEATVLGTPARPDPAAFLNDCVARQAVRVAEQLRERSAVVRESATVLPAVYDLDEYRVSALAPV